MLATLDAISESIDFGCESFPYLLSQFPCENLNHFDLRASNKILLHPSSTRMLVMRTI
jgi:hypothetical protein